MKHSDLVIIGGGPAGLAAAISAGRSKHKRKLSITLLESNPACGRKLLLSGSGQCNFTNNLTTLDFLQRCGNYANYLKPAYYNFDKEAFIKLLADAGCTSFTREDGKVFPASMKAMDVRDALIKHVLAAGVTIVTNTKAASIIKHSDDVFQINLASGNSITCNRLIICGGGASYPQTGSDGKTLGFAQAMGHTSIAFRPHLGSVDIQGFKLFIKCAGIAMPDVRVVFNNNASRSKATGDLLVTHTGLSGPLILDNCHNIHKGTEILIQWVPDADALVMNAQKKYPNSEILNALCEVPIPKSLLRAIFESNGLSLTGVMKSLSSIQIKLTSSAVSQTKFCVSRVQSLETCMASAGGVPLAEINAKTMQSRICPGLYFAGEILDYALPTGGFNIQMAASTGWLAGAKATSD